jgi:hypothetical protein
MSEPEFGRWWGYELTETQNKWLNANLDLKHYCMELVGRKTENVGPGVVPIPDEVKSELEILLERIEEHE